MKKLIYLIPLMFLAVGCSDDEVSIEESVENKQELVATRKCATVENHERLLAENPGLAKKMELLELNQSKMVANMNTKLLSKKYRIPVVVNVVYRLDNENISDQQIQSQIDVLNKDFNARNEEYASVPAPFNTVRANVGFEFELVAINRKFVNKVTWGVGDLVKSNQGILPTNPETHLNIWVCTIGSFALGYAQMPGGNPNTDGVVIGSKYFGTTGTATAPYNKGRTTTHEVGHWFNLIHIWGDSLCGTDLVSDTPQHDSYNSGVPTFPHKSTCIGNPIEMTMNYMDYVNDSAMAMFSLGQKTRMLATVGVGGPREAYATEFQ